MYIFFFTIILTFILPHGVNGQYIYTYGFPFIFFTYYDPDFYLIPVNFSFNITNFILNILCIYFFLRISYFIIVKLKSI